MIEVRRLFPEAYVYPLTYEEFTAHWERIRRGLDEPLPRGYLAVQPPGAQPPTNSR
jgi:hypothetical protein